MSTDALLSVIAGHDTSGLFEVRCRNPSNGRITAREWFGLDERQPCLRFIATRSSSLDVYIGAALRTRREGGKSAIRHSWCLWADVDDPTGLERLAAFIPRPSLIVGSGSGRNVHAYWSLSEPIPPAWLERANRRLAYHLRADMKAVDIARVLRPPGTLNHKHRPPAQVTADSFQDTSGSVASVVKNLPDPASKSPVARQARQDIHSDDPLLGIPADHYYHALTGLPVTVGNVTCPFHGEGKERNPSMRLYDTSWYCFSCGEGGSVIQFAALLWDYSLPVRGAEFLRLRERLSDALG